MRARVNASERSAVRTGASEELEASRAETGGRAAFLVAAGMLLSRIAGLVRDRVFAHYFGNSDAADAFRAALRIPNLLQNLFGEGVLSASFIPVYVGLVSAGDEREARRVAGAVAGLLSLLTSLLVVGGIFAAPWLVEIITPGFHGEKRALVVHLVQILFPGVGLLVLSAWCLGILNSHRRFFLSYAAPVVWNAAIIAAMLLWGGRLGQYSLAGVVAWGAVAGSALQLVVQLPTVRKLVGRLPLSLDAASAKVRTVLRNFGPVFVSRGVVQISAYVDAVLASFLPGGALAALAYAQTLYLLPVSLFGLSVSAAELPAMSSARGNVEEIARGLRGRLDPALRRIAVLVVPSAMAFLALGDVVAATIYQTGRFSHADAIYVWAVLAGSAVGLLAATLGRLYASAYYALQDTRTPLKFATLRVVLTGVLGYLLALRLPGLVGIAPRWGLAGLTISAGLAAWLEFGLLRSTLNRRIGRTGLARGYVLRLWAAAAVAAAAGWAIKLALPAGHPLVTGLLVLAPYGICYFAMASLLGVQEAKEFVRRLPGLR